MLPPAAADDQDSHLLVLPIPLRQVVESSIPRVEGHHYLAGGAVALFRDDQFRLLHLILTTDSALLLVRFFAFGAYRFLHLIVRVTVNEYHYIRFGFDGAGFT